MIEEKRFAIRILAPAHVGCDEVYEPAGFIIDESQYILHTFDPLDFLRNLSRQEMDRMSSICGKGTVESILELYKFMKGRRFDGHRVAVCPGFLDNYRKTLAMAINDRKKIQQELNNFSIARTAFNPTTQRPCIPGSAIKGALRTAYLNGRQAAKKLPRAKNAAQLERDLLDGGAFESDPFRLMKISDFHPLGPCRTKIVYAVNKKKKPSKYQARGPYQTLEVIEPGAVFVGTIQVLQPLTRDVIKTPLTEKAIFDCAASFYGKEKVREDRELKEAGLPALNWGKMDDAVPLRIGRHSGAESLTIEGHRKIRIMQGKGKPAISSDTGATTLWLAAESSDGYQKDSLRPFGWASLGRLSAEMAVQLAGQETAEAATVKPIQRKVDEIAEQKSAQGVPSPPVEEIWEEAYVSYDAGGGGVLKTTAKDGKRKAELRGMEKAQIATDASLHKKLFEKPKNVPKALVTVRKVGNHYEILSVKAINLS